MRFLRCALVDKCEHRLAHCLCTAQGFIGGKSAHRAGDKLDGCVRSHLSMRDKQRARLGVEEGAGEAR